jgi:hypothetical protein
MFSHANANPYGRFHHEKSTYSDIEGEKVGNGGNIGDV